MAYINQRMPRSIAAGFTVGPRWNTGTVHLANGREQRNALWLFPKYEGRAGYAAFSPAAQETLLAMLNACRGKLHAFRFFDPTDHDAVNEPLLTVAGVTYLSKSYAFGSETSYRLIQAPVTATLSGAGSVDLDTGIVTGAAPGDTWSGTFDIWMRFDSDWGAFTAQASNFYSADIELIEVRR